MRRSLPLVLFSCIVAICAGGAPSSAADPVAELDAYAARGGVDWGVPGLAIAVVKDGQVVLARGYGVRELGSEGAVGSRSTTGAMPSPSTPDPSTAWRPWSAWCLMRS